MEISIQWQRKKFLLCQIMSHIIKLNSQGTGKNRVYVQLRNHPAMTADELGNEVQRSCSVTASDLKAVMAELSAIAVRELSQGNRFYLPGIGYLS